MKQSLFIGVDGGATKCTVRVEDAEGHLLGIETSGPANIRISVTQAWQSINTALEKILNSHGMILTDKKYHWHAGMGLAGCEIHSAYENFLEQPHHFETLVISSDAHTACLGAHGGDDGAIIIVGTGVVGFQVEAGQTTKIGGWGFPHDDQGGGAWLGLEAVKITLQCLDGRLPISNLALAVYAHFANDFDRLITWANQANSTAFAELAPLVVEQCHAADPAAIHIMKEAAQEINRIALALQASQHNATKKLSCSLVGGIAPFLEPYLDKQLRDSISLCQSTPDAGAVMLVRNYLTEAKAQSDEL